MAERTKLLIDRSHVAETAVNAEIDMGQQVRLGDDHDTGSPEHVVMHRRRLRWRRASRRLLRSGLGGEVKNTFCLVKNGQAIPP